MIRVSRSDGGEARLHLEDEVLAAFIDADWIPAGDGPVHGPYIAADGEVGYRGRHFAFHAADPAALIRGWITALVDEVAGLMHGIPRDRVQVTGRGLTADQIRRRLGVVETGASRQAPEAVIEMTGKAAVLRRATEDVVDGGLIILAGESDPPVEINLYKDVHRRGLHVLGAPCLDETWKSGSEERRDLPEPVAVQSGKPLPVGLWYRVAR